ncbi:hypothetical protein Cgig2_004979 [Carnegiea gigantea]|uniref:ELMO domain-containing protein n=1 Tax=Carnegiea gigantea TaxID=171969 RepID=A0A9Q1L191_9CARY|nr:hypothetical protein Cgig2_004979 [Carnegiea gigantea]
MGAPNSSSKEDCLLRLQSCIDVTFDSSNAEHQDLLRKQEGDRALWEYPFAVAGVNITFMLIQMLDLEAGMPTQIYNVMDAPNSSSKAEHLEFDIYKRREKVRRGERMTFLRSVATTTTAIAATAVPAAFAASSLSRSSSSSSTSSSSSSPIVGL